MVKILTITPFFPPHKGGLPDHVLNLNMRLAERGNDVSIVVPKHLRDRISEHYGNLKVTRINSIYFLGWPYPTLRAISFPIDFGTKIKSIMRKGNFDIVHVHGHHYPISWLAINSAHKYGIPLALTLHGMYSLNPNVLEGRSIIEDYFNKLTFKKLLPKVNAIIGLTEKNTNYAKRFGDEYIKYFTIPNGINIGLFKENLKRKNEYRQKYGIGEDKIVILFRGRLEKVKGIIEFAEAAKKIIKDNRIEVIIVGGGSLESNVKSILKNIDRVHIIDWQPTEMVHELYIASDIFVIPSMFEAQGITVIEAMNAGLHILYSSVGGIPETVRGYSRKTMLKEVSSDEIHNSLTRLTSEFSNNDDLDSSLTYAQQFDWNKIILDTIQVYSYCINQ